MIEKWAIYVKNDMKICLYHLPTFAAPSQTLMGCNCIY